MQLEKKLIYIYILTIAYTKQWKWCEDVWWCFAIGHNLQKQNVKEKWTIPSLS